MSATVFEEVNQLDGDVLGEEIRALAITGGVVINRGLSMGMALKLSCPDTSCYGPNERTALYNQLRAAMNSLPENFDLEWRFTPGFDASPLDELYREYAGARPAGLLGDVIDELQNETKRLFGEKEVRFFTTYVIVVRRMPLSLAQRRARTKEGLKELQAREDARSKPGFAKKLARIAEDFKVRFLSPDLLVQFEEEEFRMATEDLLRQVRSMEQSMRDAGLSPVVCDDDAALDLFYQYWNRDQHDKGMRASKFAADREVPVSDYVVRSPFFWDTSGKTLPRGVFELDGIYHRLVSVTMPPQQIGSPVWPHFEGMLLYNGPRSMEMIVKCIQGDRSQRLSLLRKEIDRSAKGIETTKKQNSAGVDSERKYLAQLKEEYSSIEGALERTWKAGIYFHLWDKDLEKLADALSSLRKIANMLDVQLCEESVSAHNYWRHTQPFWTQDADRNRLFDYTSQQLVGMLPISGQKTYLEAGRPLGAVFTTANRSLFNFFTHDPRRTDNAHMAISAGSRKGKSTLLNRIMVEMARHPTRCVVIDLGGSFRRFCATMGGNYIDFDTRNRNQCLNPLFIEGFRAPDEEELRARVLVLEQMMCDHRSSERFTPEDNAKVTEALRLTYQKKKGEREEVTLSDLHDQLKKMNLIHWTTRLHEWVGVGSRAALFDGKNTINMSNPLTVLDFQRTKDDVQLSAVLFHVAMVISGQLAANYPNDLKFVVCDEASMHLRNPVAAEAIGQAIRTFAKHGVGVCVLSQNFGDFTENSVTRETFTNNVPTWIFLGQGSNDTVERIAEEKQLSPSEKAKLANLKTVYGQYSEFLVVQNVAGRRETSHCFSIATPLMYALMTTSAPDRAIFEKYASQGLSLPDAVRRFAKEYPHGADVDFKKEQT